ncbi:hypothetical protein [Halobacillus naozhouensis]|uniref:Uncharacterized protein n=1 Tax=Halobacillus naozhouensis TaxID=554880 RepID=A0ABY8IYQ6_9BACI|nr:hypothetical protein [Halobacillus naozhouensis]WFT74319.1 hypothetical protein P9989_18465 [Halobacillus naozhouensis]
MINICGCWFPGVVVIWAGIVLYWRQQRNQAGSLAPWMATGLADAFFNDFL